MNELDIYNAPFEQIKQFSPQSWCDLDVSFNQVKVASSGITGADARDALKFMSEKMLHAVKTASLNPDCFYVHNIAMGGSRRYGPNRWGDGFREEVLRRDVPTFEKAKAYRRHKSGKGDPFFGNVKFASFRESDGVVELITEYFGTPKVAQAQGGSVADQEIECLMKHGVLPVSMGSWVPGDVCVACGHFAKKPKFRCSSKREGGNCRLFGCKTGMLKVSDEGELQYVDNPRNRFYDISMVKIGADPIAYGGLMPIGDFYDQLGDMNSKSASLFEELGDTTLPSNPGLDRYLTSLHAQSECEQKFASYLDESEYDYAVGCHFSNDVPASVYSLLSSGYAPTIAQGITEVIEGGSTLNFSRYLEACGKSASLEATHFPNLFTRIRAASLSGQVAEQAYTFEKYLPTQVRKVASIGSSQLDLSYKVSGLSHSDIVHSSLRHLADGYRAVPLTARTVHDTIPDYVLKFASILTVCDAHGGNDVSRFVTFGKNSTRLKI